jgi:hypothetical protein
MKLFNSLSVITILSVALAMHEQDYGEAVTSEDSEGKIEDRFINPFNIGRGFVNAKVGVTGVGNVQADVLGSGGIANAKVDVLGIDVGANVGGNRYPILPYYPPYYPPYYHENHPPYYNEPIYPPPPSNYNAMRLKFNECILSRCEFEKKKKLSNYKYSIS